MSASTRIRLLQGSGVLLILLGIVHLAATPHIAALIRHSASPAAADQLAPPMLLNHILVGLLLFPLGYLTVYAAPSSAAGLPWAQAIVRTTALTVATLPVTLLALMGVRYFDAPLFVLGAALVVAAAATLLVAAFSRPRGKNSATGPDATNAKPVDEASIFFKERLIWCKRAAGARSSMKRLLVRPRASVSSIRACPWA